MHTSNHFVITHLIYSWPLQFLLYQFKVLHFFFTSNTIKHAVGYGDVIKVKGLFWRLWFLCTKCMPCPKGHERSPWLHIFWCFYKYFEGITNIVFFLPGTAWFVNILKRNRCKKVPCLLKNFQMHVCYSHNALNRAIFLKIFVHDPIFFPYFAW